MRSRLMVGRDPLKVVIGVRIPAPQLFDAYQMYDVGTS